jgi:hypothetical protein
MALSERSIVAVVETVNIQSLPVNLMLQKLFVSQQFGLTIVAINLS